MAAKLDEAGTMWAEEGNKIICTRRNGVLQAVQ